MRLKEGIYEWDVLFTNNKRVGKRGTYGQNVDTYGWDIRFCTSTTANDGYTTTTYDQSPVLICCK